MEFKVMPKELLIKINNFLGTHVGIFLLGSLVGLIFFYLLFGFAPLDVTNINYALNAGGDTLQPYIGWVYYRDSAWSFPNVGAIDGLLSSSSTFSIAFTDSVSLLAIPFKLLSPILPHTFQFVGIWTLLCYILQGGLAALLLLRFTKNKIAMLFGTVFFVLSPMMIQRAFGHEPLTGHWLILLAILLMITFSHKTSFRKQIISWSVVSVLTILVHPYFLPMTSVLMFISVIRTYIKKQNLTTALKILVPLVLAVLIFYLIGGFGSDSGVFLDDIRKGFYNADLLSLFNPFGYSAYIKQIIQNPAGSGSQENLVYLGLGMILLLAVVFVLWFSKYVAPRKPKELWTRFRNFMNGKRVLIACVIVALVFISVGEPIRFADHVLFTINLPEKLEKLWSIFRANGRMLWPVYYLIILGVLVFMIKYYKNMRPTYFAILLLPFVAIQAIDIMKSPTVDNRQLSIRHIFTKPYQLSEDQKKLIKNDFCDFKNVEFLDYDPGRDLHKSDSFQKLALTQENCRLSFNAGNIDSHTKVFPNEIAATREKLNNNVVTEKDFSTNIYVTFDKQYAAELKSKGYIINAYSTFWVVQGQSLHE